MLKMKILRNFLVVEVQGNDKVWTSYSQLQFLKSTTKCITLYIHYTYKYNIFHFNTTCSLKQNKNENNVKDSVNKYVKILKIIIIKFE